MTKPFQGVINLDVRDSVADWTPFREPAAPEGAPNVLLVLYDDDRDQYARTAAAGSGSRRRRSCGPSRCPTAV